MGAVSRKLRITETGYAHWCPACARLHTFTLRGPFVPPPSWSFNYNVEHPTFEPSMDISHPARADMGIPAYRCHYFLRGGFLIYDTTSTHALSGQAVELPDLPPEYQGVY